MISRQHLDRANEPCAPRTLAAHHDKLAEPPNALGIRPLPVHGRSPPQSPAMGGARDDAPSPPNPHSTDRPPSRRTRAAVRAGRSGAARPTCRRPTLAGGRAGGTHRPIPSRHLRAPVAATATGSRHPPAHVATRHRGPGWVARPPALPRARSVTPSISPTSRRPADARGGRRSWSAGCPGAHAPPVLPGFFLIRRRRVGSASLIRYSVLNDRDY